MGGPKDHGPGLLERKNAVAGVGSAWDRQDSAAWGADSRPRNATPAGGHPLIGAARVGLGTFGSAWNPTTALRDEKSGEVGGGLASLSRPPWSGASHVRPGSGGGGGASGFGEAGGGLHSAMRGASSLLGSGAAAVSGSQGEPAWDRSSAVAGAGRTLGNGAAAVGQGLGNLASTSGGGIARGWHKLFG